MRKTLSAAIAAACLMSGSAVLFHGGTAEAQVFDSLRKQQKGQSRRGDGCSLAAAEGQRQYRMSQEECAAVAPLLQAIAAEDWAAAQLALQPAQAAARGSDAKYVVAQAMLRIGIGTNSAPLQAQAIDAMIASGGAEATEMPRLYQTRLGLALAAGDTATAERIQGQLDALNPNDPARFIRQADIRIRANDAAGAFALYQQAVEAARAAGQPVPPAWRQQIAALAYQARRPDTLRYMREWLEAAPSESSWHDTLAIYAEQDNVDGATKLDAYRLMRAAGAMLTERDFIQYAESAAESRLYGEVVAVLEDGLRRNLITTNAAYARERLGAASGRTAGDRASLPEERRTALAGRDGQVVLRLADAYFGYGDYAEAAQLYRAALERGANANLVNLRLGAALALAGQRSEAEAAFGAVTGPRAELAALWRLWLSRRG